MSGDTTWDTAEIAQYLQCSRTHATNRVVKHPRFPRPVVALSQKLRRWRAEDVRAYVSKDAR